MPASKLTSSRVVVAGVPTGADKRRWPGLRQGKLSCAAERTSPAEQTALSQPGVLPTATRACVHPAVQAGAAQRHHLCIRQYPQLAAINAPRKAACRTAQLCSESSFKHQLGPPSAICSVTQAPQSSGKPSATHHSTRSLCARWPPARLQHPELCRGLLQRPLQLGVVVAHCPQMLPQQV